jgi:hypothetical protein
VKKQFLRGRVIPTFFSVDAQPAIWLIRRIGSAKDKGKRKEVEKSANKGHYGREQHVAVCCEMETITYFPHSCRSLWRVVAA